MRGREHERERKQRIEVTVRQGGLILADWISCVCAPVYVCLRVRESFHASMTTYLIHFEENKPCPKLGQRDQRR